MPLQATSGAASYDAFGGGVPVVPNYIEDVFSTWLYTGTSATRTITNNIDLSSKGGLVWIKSRTSAQSHILNDTARGAGNNLLTDSTSSSLSINDTLTAFGTTGFTLGADSNAVVNGSGQNYVSWSLREQPKFFDIVTWTGNGTNRTIAHNLGSVPACILVKSSSGGYAWAVYHSSLANTEYLVLNTTAAKATDATYWNSTTPTATEFSIGTAIPVNNSGATYVAYLFAHNAGGFGLTGTDNVISCGSTAGGNVAVINLGYEPQLLIYKSATAVDDWHIIDNMRGASINSAADGVWNELKANTSGAETTVTGASGQPNVRFLPNGFQIGAISGTAIYIAIRRGPMKVPTSGTSVFVPATRTGTGAATTITSAGFPVDLVIGNSRNAVSYGAVGAFGDRLRGKQNLLYSEFTNAEDTANVGITGFDVQNGISVGGNDAYSFNYSGGLYVNWFMRRAPSFFDVVCYTGTGVSGRTVTHNLGVAPELMFVKSRSAADGGLVYNKTITASKYLELFFTGEGAFPVQNDVNGFTGVEPTSSVFTVGSYSNVNGSGSNYVAYLFATCAGVSKVFSYTGNGSSQTINCGFTGGARFVLIKRTDSTGDWYVWDTARGIVSGNDPHLSLNSTAAEVTSNDTIDTDSTGFVVNQVSATNVNVSSATYIGLAIA